MEIETVIVMIVPTKTSLASHRCHLMDHNCHNVNRSISIFNFKVIDLRSSHDTLRVTRKDREVKRGEDSFLISSLMNGFCSDNPH